MPRLAPRGEDGRGFGFGNAHYARNEAHLFYTSLWFPTQIQALDLTIWLIFPPSLPWNQPEAFCLTKDSYADRASFRLEVR